MFGLSKHGPDGRYGAVIDIGSGSAGVAIIVSDPLETNPKIIWSYRERMVLRDHINLAATEKNITTTIVNAILELGNTGIRALHEYDRKARLDSVLITISAPWSYTVARTATISEKQPFTVSPELIEELTESASAQAKAAVNEDLVIEQLELEVITNTTVGISANGYRIHNPYVSEIEKLTLSQLIGMAEKQLISATREALEKVLPNIEVFMGTFMQFYYQVLNVAHPDTTEICLIDITAEATELGIVRDSILKHTTFIPVGLNSLARDISKLCNLPKEEALGYFRANQSDSRGLLTAEKQAELDAIVAQYENLVAALFTRTGDTLSIPKTVFLHTDAATEQFFSDILKKATRTATGTKHVIHPITSEFFNPDMDIDTAILLSAHVFHNHIYETSYLTK